MQANKYGGGNSKSVAAVGGVRNTLLPVTSQTLETVQRLAELSPGARVSVSANCHFDQRENTLRGWYCKLPPLAPAARVPFPPSMFDGVTVVETQTPETRILELLRDRRQTLERLSRVAEQHTNVPFAARASWHRCRPHRDVPLQKTHAWNYVLRAENLARYATVSEGGESVRIASDAPVDLVPDEQTPNYIDQAAWEPELATGGFIGLYHQWYPLVNGGRELKLFLVCQSHCEIAGLEIKQIVNELDARATVRDVARAEETWWLANVNMRNRRRLLLSVAKGLGLSVATCEDTHAAGLCEMAMATAETLSENIYQYQDGCCGFANACVPSIFVSNGVVCKMSPWEGIGLYNGPHRSAGGAQFGTAFGTDMDVFPTGTVALLHEDEGGIRAARLVVHRHVAMCSDFWMDSGGAVTREGPAAEVSTEPEAEGGAAAAEMAEMASATASAAAAGFQGVDAPELNEVALGAWMRAKTRGMQGQCAREAREGPRRMCSGRPSFVSFTDHHVVRCLAASGWEPRDGMLQLLPLALYTHQHSATRR